MEHAPRPTSIDYSLVTTQEYRNMTLLSPSPEAYLGEIRKDIPHIETTYTRLLPDIMPEVSENEVEKRYGAFVDGIGLSLAISCDVYGEDYLTTPELTEHLLAPHFEAITSRSQADKLRERVAGVGRLIALHPGEAILTDMARIAYPNQVRAQAMLDGIGFGLLVEKTARYYDEDDYENACKLLQKAGIGFPGDN